MLRAIFLALSLAASPAMAERASLSELSAYLNSITVAEARFTQINGDGSRSSGTVTIKRPGRIRFEYDPPQEDVLVLASGGQIAIFDGRGAGAPEQYPLRRTPLSILLARSIDLTRVSMVTGHGEQNGRTVVQAQDPEHPEYGRIYMFFDRAPLRLSEWLIISESGEQTRVQLGPFRATPDASDFLFDIRNETRRRG